MMCLQVTVPGTNVLSRWCHNNVESEKEIYNGILSTQIKLVKTFSLTTSFIGMAVHWCSPSSGQLWSGPEPSSTSSLL